MVLPRTYETALRLQAEGADHEALAEVLGVPIEAIPALLAIALAKQAREAEAGE